MPNLALQNDARARTRGRGIYRWTWWMSHGGRITWPSVSLCWVILFVGIGCTDTLVEPLVWTTNPNGTTCAPPATACGDECYDLSSSNGHCGACDIECSGGAYCAAGSCICPEGQTMCNGVCTSLDSDPHNCGACDRSCGNDDACLDGDCKSGCKSTAKYCDGACVDVKSSNDHCGDCSIECSNGQSCQNGDCECDLPLVACDKVCVDMDKDPMNCGGCNKVCGGGQTCNDGKCQ